jgi:radical SAM superfamily enzyme YgiQ (UPF0313 family)
VLCGDARFARWIDSFTVGEADQTLLHLVEAIAGEREAHHIPNLVRYANGRVLENLQPGVHPSLDWLPPPDYTMMPMERYFAPKQVICMTPTRGCYYNKCTFCNYSFIKLTPYRMRSPSLIALDVETVVNATGQDVFSFETDVILPRDLGLISEALLERGLDVAWHGVARFEKGFTNELMATMRRAGCVRLYMGLESANDQVLAAMQKGADARRMAEILAMCHTAGISVEAGVFSGFPAETPEQAEETYRFVRDHRHVISRADAGTFRLLKGSPMADNPGDYGITIQGDPNRHWYHLDYSDRTSRSTEAAARLIDRIQQLYPQVALIDVPEDILYTARYGPDVLRRFFDPAREPDREEEPAAGPDDEDRLVLALSSTCELRRLTVTNSGAVRLDIADTATGGPFEKSALSITVAVDWANASVRPLGRAEEALLRTVGRTGMRFERLYELLAAEIGRRELRAAVLSLLQTGPLTVCPDTTVVSD